MLKARLWLSVLLFVSSAHFVSGQWSKPSAPFDGIALARNGEFLWMCGANASIASSPDGGNQWVVKNSKDGAGALLSLRWHDQRVGAAGGTGGLVLVSTDGGTTWNQTPTSFSDPVLDLSFADAQHGLVLTTAAVLYTADGGKTWRPVLPSSSADLSRYKYVLALAMLDEKHAAVLVKEGPAQYYSGRIYATADGGATWNASEIEHTNLNNLLVAHGQLWLVGQEVVEREKQGGHAVPVSLYSSDAKTWNHGPQPLIDTNYACRPEGCLMSNGAWFETLVPNGKIHSFPASQTLSTQWSATDTRICTLGPDLQCADTQVVPALPKRSGPPPQLAATELRPTTGDVAGKCIRCDYPHILINEQFAGKATVKLTVLTRRDGTVSSAEVMSSPNPEIGAALSQAARGWIFYPTIKDGIPVPTKRTADVAVSVIKPR